MSKEQQLWQASTEGNLEIVKTLLGDPTVDVNWQDEEIGRTPLLRACGHGNLLVAEVLLNHPQIQPDLQQKEGATPLSIASQEGHYEVVLRLLRDPRVDPSKPDSHGRTPLRMACLEGHSRSTEGVSPLYTVCEKAHIEALVLMLADPRVDPNKPKANQTSPLWFATQQGHLEVVRHLLASGKEVNTKLVSTFNSRTAAEQGRAMAIAHQDPDDSDEAYDQSKINGPRCADLIDEYDKDPEATRVRLRRLPGLREYYVGYIFSLVVFFSDGFLTLKPPADDEFSQKVGRFFNLASRLPMDLQMVLCSRMFGSPRDVILSKDSERGFRWLARTTLWE